ncbi:hypothetical protein FSARC_11153 [Fusarium sarcochroum]|uniref:Acyl-CoA dehydrogenase/oxidase C-terminal domain-containing protein n=1 Tax=Fusarium sarcochroum TaxID=1208366 RepID=A0A8H4X0Z3_9HYPO|nr:hypothetical protein FSARC_11153 [Fusarium sarcochroum]
MINSSASFTAPHAPAHPVVMASNHQTSWVGSHAITIPGTTEPNYIRILLPLPPPRFLPGRHQFLDPMQGSRILASDLAGASSYYGGYLFQSQLTNNHHLLKKKRVAGTELNGVRIRRLKQKLGTKPLPTSELELKGMRGWLIGKEGKGINEVGIVLNITRIHLTIGVLGAAGRALSAARAFARMMLGFFVTALLARSEKQQLYPPPLLDLVPKSSQDVSCLLRLLGSVAKASAAMDTCGVVQTAMESLGGVGYLENDEMYFNVARLWRDTSSVLIGEGTTDVLATDVVKVMKGKIGSYVMQAYGRWVKSSLPKKDFMAPEAAILSQQWLDLQAAISSHSLEYLTLNGREIMDGVCKLTSGILLLADASRDEDPVAMEVARRWIKPSTFLSGSSVEKELMLDQQIVFGEQPTF